MARKSNDSELKQTWQAAAACGDDGMRALVQRVVQQVLEAEMTSFLAAENYERTPGKFGICGEQGGDPASSFSQVNSACRGGIVHQRHNSK